MPILITLAVVLTSFFYFPFEFTFLPGLNTKVMLAAMGIPLMLFHVVKLRDALFSTEVLIATLIAIFFSLIGLYTVDLNNTTDYVYASYVVSMWLWLTAAYTICSFIAWVHGKLSIRLIVNYLVAVCLAQCALALLIDFVPAVKIFVDHYFSMGITEFLNKVQRLYGIGASLDVAGVRFSAVLLMISFMLSQHKKESLGSKQMTTYVISFLLIAGIGNMISRTTLLGMIGGISYFLFRTILRSPTISYASIKLWSILLVTAAGISIIGIYFYNNNAEIHALIRFGFEGFFNWMEKGEWRTDSTDRLNSTMWIWPESNDTKTWLIGKALFSNWHDVGTDIGYCRFIFYNGLLGLCTFVIFFCYLTVSLANRFRQFYDLFWLLFLLLLVNWFKVSTDIFLVYSLFLAIGFPYLSNKYVIQNYK